MRRSLENELVCHHHHKRKGFQCQTTGKTDNNNNNNNNNNSKMQARGNNQQPPRHPDCESHDDEEEEEEEPRRRTTQQQHPFRLNFDAHYDDLLDELLSDDVDPSPKTTPLETPSSPMLNRFWATTAADEDDHDYHDYYPREDIENLSFPNKSTMFKPSSPPPSFSPSPGKAPLHVLPKAASAGDADKYRYHKNRRRNHNNEVVQTGRFHHQVIMADQGAEFPKRRLSTGCIQEPTSHWLANQNLLQPHDQNHEQQQRQTSEQMAAEFVKEEGVPLYPANNNNNNSNDEDDDDDDEQDGFPEIQHSATISTQSTQSTTFDMMMRDPMVMAYSIDSLDNIKPSGSTASSTEGPPSIKESTTTTSSAGVDAGGGAPPPEEEEESQPTADEEGPNEDPYEWAYNVWKRKGLMAGEPTDKRRPEAPGIATASSTESSTAPSSQSSQPRTITKASSAESSQASKRSQSSHKSHISKKSQATQASKMSNKSHASQSTNGSDRTQSTTGSCSTARIRKPKDRQSMPSRITNNSKPKARNGAGFSILLSKWQDKSDGNPNAHFLSPRELSPLRTAQPRPRELSPVRSPQSRPIPVVKSPQAALSPKPTVRSPQAAASRPTQRSPQAASVRSPNASRGFVRSPQAAAGRSVQSFQQRPAPRAISIQARASIDTTSVVSPSSRRKMLGGNPKNSSNKKQTKPQPTKLALVESCNNTEANNKTQSSSIIDTTPVLSPSRRRMQNAVDRSESGNPPSVSSQQQHPHAATAPAAAAKPHPWPTPSKNRNALSRFLQRSKQTPTQPPTLQSFGEKSRESYHKLNKMAFADKSSAEAIKEQQEEQVNNMILEITPVLPSRERPSRHSLSPKSTVSFLSPGDDTLLEPRDVMRHRPTRSDNTYNSRNTSYTPVSSSVPCKEIFVMKDDEVSLGLQSNDLRSMAGESEYNRSVEPSIQNKMHFTNLHDILEGPADSMSFDSQSQVTHISFRTETLRTLDKKVNEIHLTTSTTPPSGKTKPEDGEEAAAAAEEPMAETPLRETMLDEMVGASAVTPEYSDRPWRKDLLVRNMATAMEKARGGQFECDCEHSLALFSERDEMVDFFLPLVSVSCSCRKSKKLVNPEDPNSLENILRPWQISFLKAFGIVKGDQLVKAHHRSARSLSKSLYNWRQKNDMTTFRVGSCGMALQIWSNTCKAYVRSIRKQRADGKDPIERPNTLSILSMFLDKMPSQMHRNLPQRPSTDGNIPDSSKVEI
ncbi:kinesin family member 11 [Seminavis robusta]|uniref:Kinesin family member 11 n=1 Tax=Seminavis robusta TaxID=568900 RepID=A0A9N8DN23_9STRA|nr:kinesin family member 11 [Seminavis robusta]|eukprot:Sro251_g099350.1 kinesin family member 11 (1238) ;mRNA; r:62343-66435